MKTKPLPPSELEDKQNEETNTEEKDTIAKSIDETLEDTDEVIEDQNLYLPASLKISKRNYKRDIGHEPHLLANF